MLCAFVLASMRMDFSHVACPKLSSSIMVFDVGLFCGEGLPVCVYIFDGVW